MRELIVLLLTIFLFAPGFGAVYYCNETVHDKLSFTKGSTSYYCTGLNDEWKFRDSPYADDDGLCYADPITQADIDNDNDCCGPDHYIVENEQCCINLYTQGDTLPRGFASNECFCYNPWVENAYYNGKWHPGEMACCGTTKNFLAKAMGYGFHKICDNGYLYVCDSKFHRKRSLKVFGTMYYCVKKAVEGVNQWFFSTNPAADVRHVVELNEGEGYVSDGYCYSGVNNDEDLDCCIDNGYEYHRGNGCCDKNDVWGFDYGGMDTRPGVFSNRVGFSCDGGEAFFPDDDRYTCSALGGDWVSGSTQMFLYHPTERFSPWRRFSPEYRDVGWQNPLNPGFCCLPVDEYTVTTGTNPDTLSILGFCNHGAFLQSCDEDNDCPVASTSFYDYQEGGDYYYCNSNNLRWDFKCEQGGTEGGDLFDEEIGLEPDEQKTCQRVAEECEVGICDAVCCDAADDCNQECNGFRPVIKQRADVDGDGEEELITPSCKADHSGCIYEWDMPRVGACGVECVNDNDCNPTPQSSGRIWGDCDFGTSSGRGTNDEQYEGIGVFCSGADEHPTKMGSRRGVFSDACDKWSQGFFNSDEVWREGDAGAYQCKLVYKRKIIDECGQGNGCTTECGRLGYIVGCDPNYPSNNRPCRKVIYAGICPVGSTISFCKPSCCSQSYWVNEQIDCSGCGIYANYCCDSDDDLCRYKQKSSWINGCGGLAYSRGLAGKNDCAANRHKERICKTTKEKSNWKSGNCFPIILKVFASDGDCAGRKCVERNFLGLCEKRKHKEWEVSTSCSTSDDWDSGCCPWGATCDDVQHRKWKCTGSVKIAPVLRWREICGSWGSNLCETDGVLMVADCNNDRRTDYYGEDCYGTKNMCVKDGAGEVCPYETSQTWLSLGGC